MTDLEPHTMTDLEPPVFLAGQDGPGLAFYTSVEDHEPKLNMHGQGTPTAPPWVLTLDRADVRQLATFLTKWLKNLESPKPEHIPDLAERDTCPNPECGKSWLGDPIPETHREHFGGASHFRRVIAIYDRDKDRTVAWRCPDCEKEWER